MNRISTRLATIIATAAAVGVSGSLDSLFPRRKRNRVKNEADAAALAAAKAKRERRAARNRKV